MRCRDYAGIGTTLAGDFMQMPPVHRPGLAKDIHSQDAAGPNQDKDVEDLTEGDKGEHDKGAELWRRFDTAVILTLNLRSTGMLSNILQEMREGRITDASWKLLQQRVLGYVDPDLPSTPASPSRPGIADVASPSLRDARLDKEPFCRPNEVYHVSHRHALRVTQGYIHALQTVT